MRSLRFFCLTLRRCILLYTPANIKRISVESVKWKEKMAKRSRSGDGVLPRSVQGVLAWLKRHGNRRDRANMGARYGIHADKALGVPMARMLFLAKRLGTDHQLALRLWETGWYEARMVAALVDDPACVTARQMDRWCRDFDNWGICDTACFKLFDRTPHAFSKVAEWAKSPAEFVRRGAFALLACLALHDKTAPDAHFIRCLRFVETGALDERNFVKKSVSWALRAIGERNVELNAEVLKLARRLASAPEAAPRWVGKDAIRQLTAAAAVRSLRARRARNTSSD
jgi:3-methyladenine DNA glycosylase AlkD